MPELESEALLRLMQLADSAMPVGAAAHSFGLESLIEDGILTVGKLDSYLRGHLEESGALDAAFCRSAHRMACLKTEEFGGAWRSLNQELSARKLSRESREASLTLGRRFVRLASELLPQGAIYAAAVDAETHHVTAFGLVTGSAGIDEHGAILAWLQQSVTSLISAAQRLMPLGQTQASKMLWGLKPLIADIAGRTPQQECFNPLPEVAGMRHAKLSVRLFIS